LVTPVLALVLGVVVAGEQISVSMIVGAGLVILALLFYVDWAFGHWFERCLRRHAHINVDEVRGEFVRYK
jgi:hypothetical protein